MVNKKINLSIGSVILKEALSYLFDFFQTFGNFCITINHNKAYIFLHYLWQISRLKLLEAIKGLTPPNRRS